MSKRSIVSACICFPLSAFLLVHSACNNKPAELAETAKRDAQVTAPTRTSHLGDLPESWAETNQFGRAAAEARKAEPPVLPPHTWQAVVTNHTAKFCGRTEKQDEEVLGELYGSWLVDHQDKAVVVSFAPLRSPNHCGDGVTRLTGLLVNYIDP